MKVRFNQPEEFLQEVKRESSLLIDGNKFKLIVRVTQRYTQTKMAPNIHHVEVVAGFVNRDGQLVELADYCGDDWGKEFAESQKTIERANKLVDHLTEELNALQIEVRAGSFEP